ncbi:threonine/serine dehydratase [Pandoraea pulmonicola]|uniref:Phenylserine dehydratase n=1 Tax=Pandoraea pulmonicola TaxID=93221 RepID=A0AAJ4ZGX5_PANPU|nr:threonine/serine dehydratase [Pandoraea pulmonicola]AJC22604.1 serine/threonine dehydratase [Pandoraea pulmonicola]SUA93191.1 Phenylserine dehydratase [Pandoraea pulmonicola]
MTQSTPDLHAETIDGQPAPTRSAIAALHETLKPYVRATPVFTRSDFPTLGDTSVTFKFELLQASGTFKARGAFSNLLSLDDAQRKAGVTCVSAGNHAVAVAYAARAMGVAAKTVMLKTASPARSSLCREYGADLVLAENVHEAFDIVKRVEQEEGRYFVHPFNGYRTVLGTATLGYEWAQQTPDLDAVIVPIGGGGLIAGVATAFKLFAPHVKVYGVEPAGADAMAQSFAKGGPVKMGPMTGIADSLMAPHTELYSYTLCRRHIDELVTVTDDQMRAGMLTLFRQLKLAVEPACAAATAALMGPLRETLMGKRVGVLLCGTNTDTATFQRHIDAALAAEGNR